MQIGLVGGTGKEGSGLAMRWAQAGHSVRIGSRDPIRGKERARELSEQAQVTIEGGDHQQAIQNSEVVIVCVPYSAHAATFSALREFLVPEQIVVDVTVPLRPPKVSRVHLPPGQAAALEAAEILGDHARLVASVHHISAPHLAALEHPIDSDILVCGDDKDAKQAMITLANDLGARGLDAGALANSIALEALTPVLIHMNKAYGSRGTGVRITGIDKKS